MKTINQFFTAIAAVLLLFITTNTYAQDEPSNEPMYIVATTMHWNMDLDDFDMDAWKAVEKEYLDKVTMKNEFITNSSVYLHQLSDDNTELVAVQGYASWDAIDKAGDRTSELIEEGWPDKEARSSYFKKRSAYYSNMHSDEIYSVLQGAKMFSEPPSKDMITYVRTSHLAFPEGGTMDEIQGLMKEYRENVIYKNEFIKGYYPHRHFYGADSTIFMEAFFLDSLGDMDNMYDKNEELMKAHWPDEAAREETGKRAGKYFTGVHSDAVYKFIYGLSK